MAILLLSFLEIPLICKPNSTFSKTVSHGKRAASWKTTILSGVRGLTVLPSICISPAYEFSSPANILSKVVLPQPDGPTIVTNSPFFTSILILFKTVCEDVPFLVYILERFLTCSFISSDCAFRNDIVLKYQLYIVNISLV